MFELLKIELLMLIVELVELEGLWYLFFLLIEGLYFFTTAGLALRSVFLFYH